MSCQVGAEVGGGTLVAHHMTRAAATTASDASVAIWGRDGDRVIIMLNASACDTHPSIPTLNLPRTPHRQRTHPQNLLVGAALSNLTPPISRSELLLWEAMLRKRNTSRQTQPFIPPASTSYPACVKLRTSSALEPTLVFLPKIHPSTLALKTG